MLTYESAWDSILKLVHFCEEGDNTRVDWNALDLSVLCLGDNARSNFYLLTNLREGGGEREEREAQRVKYILHSELEYTLDLSQ